MMNNVRTSVVAKRVTNFIGNVAAKFTAPAAQQVLKHGQYADAGQQSESSHSRSRDGPQAVHFEDHFNLSTGSSLNGHSSANFQQTRFSDAMPGAPPGQNLKRFSTFIASDGEDMVHIPKTFKEALDELNRHAEDADVGAAEEAYATCWKFMNDEKIGEKNSYRRMAINTVIKAAANAADSRAAERWFYMLQENSLAPNSKSFGKVMEAHAKSGNVKKAEEWFRALGEAGFELDEVAHATLIDACAKAKNSSAAQKWYTSLQKHLPEGAVPSVHSITAVMDACAKAGDFQAANGYLFSLESRDDVSDADLVKAYTIAIDGCSRNVESQRLALGYLEKMEKKGLEADHVTYGTVIQSCLTVGDVAGAASTLQRMKEKGLAPTMNIYNMLLRKLSANGDYTQAKVWLDAARSEGLHPDLVSYNCLLIIFSE